MILNKKSFLIIHKMQDWVRWKDTYERCKSLITPLYPLIQDIKVLMYCMKAMLIYLLTPTILHHKSVSILSKMQTGGRWMGTYERCKLFITSLFIFMEKLKSEAEKRKDTYERCKSLIARLYLIIQNLKLYTHSIKSMFLS